MNVKVASASVDKRITISTILIALFVAHLVLGYWNLELSMKPTIVDLWSAFHICFGVFAGGITARVFRLTNKQFATCFTLALAVLCGWEVAEFHMQVGHFGTAVQAWHQGVEQPLDRMVVDTLVGCLGIWLQWRIRWTFWVAPAIGVIWWVVNLFLGGAHAVEKLLNLY
jgi:hypothetical protein